MARKWRYLSLGVIVFVTVAIAMSVGQRAETAPNDLDILCQVGSNISPLSNGNIVIPIYVTNFTDSIAGFQIWLNIQEPSLIKFVCDSIHIVPNGPNPPDTLYFAKFDTAGCRISGWEVVAARIRDDTTGAVLTLIGTADNGSNPIKPPLSPGNGQLIRVFCKTNGVLGDSICDSAQIAIKLNVSETRFSNQHAELIAYQCSTWVDTFYQNCAEFIGDSCISWFDTTIHPGASCVFDTLSGIYADGNVGFLCCTCGDANGDGTINISDAVYLIAYIFAGGPAPNPICRGDANGDGTVNISDAVYLISYIFAGGPAPHCP